MGEPSQLKSLPTYMELIVLTEHIDRWSALTLELEADGAVLLFWPLMERAAVSYLLSYAHLNQRERLTVVAVGLSLVRQ